MCACDPSTDFLLFGTQTAKSSRRTAKNQEGRLTWTMREAFQEVSPCRTTTTSVNSSSLLGLAATAGVGDMARWVAAAALASLSLCRSRSRSREGGYCGMLWRNRNRWNYPWQLALFALLFLSCLVVTKLVILK